MSLSSCIYWKPIQRAICVETSQKYYTEIAELNADQLRIATAFRNSLDFFTPTSCIKLTVKDIDDLDDDFAPEDETSKYVLKWELTPEYLQNGQNSPQIVQLVPAFFHALRALSVIKSPIADILFRFSHKTRRIMVMNILVNFDGAKIISPEHILLDYLCENNCMYIESDDADIVCDMYVKIALSIWAKFGQNFADSQVRQTRAFFSSIIGMATDDFGETYCKTQTTYELAAWIFEHIAKYHCNKFIKMWIKMLVCDCFCVNPLMRKSAADILTQFVHICDHAHDDLMVIVAVPT